MTRPLPLRSAAPLLLAAVGFTLPGCSGNDPTPSATTAPTEGKANRQDVVLVTLDTTRADRLGSYGYANAHTPFMDGLAARGMRFARAYTVQPLTIPAHASLMTGLYPYQHGIRSNGDSALDEGFDTLAERLRGAGYQTAGSVSAFVTTAQWGFAQGFDAYFDTLPEVEDKANQWHQERTAAEVVDDALGWLETAESDRPVFLWVHLYDAHFPYQAPELVRPELAERPYDAEIAYVDAQVGRLAKGFEAKGRDPIWAVVGDHGEAFGQHRELTHGLFTYDATQHIPMIIAGPGVEPAVVEHPVSIVDVGPTLLDLLGRPVPEALAGKAQPAAGPRPIYTEAYQLSERFSYAPHVTVVEGPLKLIEKPKPELYDLLADPKEQSNVAAARPDDVKRLQVSLQNLGPSHPTSGTSTMDPETTARLQALGYMGGGAGDLDYDNLSDPLDHLPIIFKTQQAERKGAQGEVEEAVALLHEVVDAEPSLHQVGLRLAGMLLKAKKRAEALALVDQVVSSNTDNAAVLARAASLYGRTGDDERGLALAQQALEVDPASAQAAEIVVGALGNLKRFEELDTFAEGHLAQYPDSHGVAAIAGTLRFDRGNLSGAELWLRMALKSPSPRQGVAQRLGIMAEASGKPEDALQLFRLELERYPKNEDARVELVEVLVALDKPDAALRQIERITAEPLPEGARRSDRAKRAGMRHSEAVLRFNQQDYDGAMAAVEAGLALTPEHADLLLMKANVLMKQGKKDEALTAKAVADAAHEKRLEGQKKLQEAMKAKAGTAPGK